jgi:hypothetical protein
MGFFASAILFLIPYGKVSLSFITWMYGDANASLRANITIRVQR